MKYNIELLKADIKDELLKLERIEEEYLKIKDKISLPPEEVTNYDRGAIGYLLHNFYNCCENIFSSIARFFENDLGQNTWHKNLLKRMKIEVSGFRPKVIDEELYRLLDDFRGFRHKFRHSYSFDLDWEKESLIARKFPQTVSLFKKQIATFIQNLDQIEEN